MINNSILEKMKEIWFADKPYDIKDCDLLTFYSCKETIEKGGFSCKGSSTLIIDTEEGENDIWNNMDKSSCRYMIKRADKEGIKIIVNQRINDFLKIDNLFRDQKGLPRSILTPEFIRKYGVLFVAELNNEVLGGQFYLSDHNNMRLLISSSKRLSVGKEKSVLVGAANRLIVWEAIKYAKSKKIKYFDMGGYYMGTEDEEWICVNKFKESFGGKLTTQYICQKYYGSFYNFLNFIRKKI